MKNWTAALLLAALSVASLLSALTTVLVLSSVFLPVDVWLAAAASSWRAHPVRRRWKLVQRRLWRRLDAVLRGETMAYHWRDAAPVESESSDDFDADQDGDSGDEQDHCLGILSDWKHGRICLISR